jgi:hypothetical protein
MVFVGGLHRSGTTIVAQELASHPLVSGFSGTGVQADEGQHLQTVYPTARTYGGPGRFAFDPRAHVTESSPLATEDSRARLLAEWSPHWDPDKPVWVEKSPPNMLMTRFLGALFPDASFLIVLRHPLAVTMATRKWQRQEKLVSLLRHWFRAHDILASDLPMCPRYLLVKYEHLVADPSRELGAIYRWLDIDYVQPAITFRSSNGRYFDRWAALAGRGLLSRLYFRAMELAWEPAARKFGYSLRQPYSALPWTPPS